MVPSPVERDGEGSKVKRVAGRREGDNWIICRPGPRDELR